jgi:FKBP-type peptidyl-prolyl cis-trans isomerase
MKVRHRSVYNLLWLLVWCLLAIPQSYAGRLLEAPSYCTKSGFEIVQLSAGDENTPLAEAGDTVTARYEGVFEPQSIVPGGRPQWDSVFLKAQPQKFVLGPNKAFKAIEEALTHMRIGSRVTVWVPSEVACPELRVPPIPPTAEVGFDIELVKIEGSDYLHRSVPEKRNP